MIVLDFLQEEKKEEIRQYKRLHFMWSFNHHLLLLDITDSA